MTDAGDSIGDRCQIALDGVGYFVTPGTYKMTRLRNATVIPTNQPSGGPIAPIHGPIAEAAGADTMLAGTGTKIHDRGPNARVWTMQIMCTNTLHDYAGQPLGDIGQELRDQLTHSYDKVATILTFDDPTGQDWNVTFSEYVETIDDLRTQRLGLNYLVNITLTESV